MHRSHTRYSASSSDYPTPLAGRCVAIQSTSYRSPRRTDQFDSRRRKSRRNDRCIVFEMQRCLLVNTRTLQALYPEAYQEKHTHKAIYNLDAHRYYSRRQVTTSPVPKTHARYNSSFPPQKHPASQSVPLRAPRNEQNIRTPKSPFPGFFRFPFENPPIPSLSPFRPRSN